MNDRISLLPLRECLSSGLFAEEEAEGNIPLDPKKALPAAPVKRILKTRIAVVKTPERGVAQDRARAGDANPDAGVACPKGRETREAHHHGQEHGYILECP